MNFDVIQPLPKETKGSSGFSLSLPASPNHHSPISYHTLAMETMMVNTQGTLELLKFAKTNHAKFLFASTSETYGDPLEHPQSESSLVMFQLCPRSVYDEAKRFEKNFNRHFWRQEKLDARIARIFNTYGPGMHKTTCAWLWPLFPIFTKQTHYGFWERPPNQKPLSC